MKKHIVLVVAVLLAGCAQQASSFDDVEKRYNDFALSRDVACIKGFAQARVGMTDIQVLRVMLPCVANHKNTTDHGAHVHEQWVYTAMLGGFEPQYLYFTDHRLEAIQTTW
jgi:hypothetical protein